MHLRGLGAYARGEAARLDGELGAFADLWAGAYRAACLANAHGELTAPIATLQQALLQIESLASVEAGANRPRRLDRIRARLAMLEQTRDAAVALAHARDAAAWYRAVGGYSAEATGRSRRAPTHRRAVRSGLMMCALVLAIDPSGVGLSR